MIVTARAVAVPAGRCRAVLCQNRPARFAQLVDRRHVSCVDGLPLLLGPIDVSAFVVQVAETLDETLVRSAPGQGVQMGAAQEPVTSEETKDFKITFGELNPLSGSLARHTGASFTGLIGPRYW